MINKAKKIISKIDSFINAEKNNVQIVALVVILLILSRMLVYCSYRIYLGYTPDGPELSGSIFRALSRLDSAWYQSVIFSGYNIEPMYHPEGNAANWAFFPLVPMALRFLSKIFTNEITTIATIFNTVVLGGALVVFYKYVALTRKSHSDALMFVLLTAFGPYTFYYSTIYTESCFLFFLGLSLYFLKTKKYILMGISGALLSATRNIGAFFVFVILIEYLMEIYRSKDYSLKNIFNGFRNPKFILGVSLCPLGIFSYMAYLGNLMGDPLAFLRIQIAWSKPSELSALDLLYTSFKSIGTYDFYYAVWGIFALIMLYKAIRNGRWEEAILAAIFIFVPMSVRMASLPRYLVCSGMLTLACVDWLHKWKKEDKAILLLLLVIFEHVLAIAWFTVEIYIA